MFMVASSVVSTILILNYHHRNADTHEMSDWVSFALRSEKRLFRLKPNQKKKKQKKSSTMSENSHHKQS
jgi:Neurotransmitter-gated ion-channel transmembrane region